MTRGTCFLISLHMASKDQKCFLCCYDVFFSPYTVMRAINKESTLSLTISFFRGSLPVPPYTQDPISRPARSTTQTCQHGYAVLGMLHRGPHPFRRFIYSPYCAFARSAVHNHPTRRDIISAHQAGTLDIWIYLAVTDPSIKPISGVYLYIFVYKGYGQHPDPPYLWQYIQLKEYVGDNTLSWESNLADNL